VSIDRDLDHTICDRSVIFEPASCHHYHKNVTLQTVCKHESGSVAFETATIKKDDITQQHVANVPKFKEAT